MIIAYSRVPIRIDLYRAAIKICNIVARTTLTISRCMSCLRLLCAREKVIPRTYDAPDLYVTTGLVSCETWSTGSQADDVPQAPKARSPREIDTSGNRRCARANRTPTVLDESPFFRNADSERFDYFPPRDEM